MPRDVIIFSFKATDFEEKLLEDVNALLSERVEEYELLQVVMIDDAEFEKERAKKYKDTYGS